jgi:hypothetical protein
MRIYLLAHPTISPAKGFRVVLPYRHCKGPLKSEYFPVLVEKHLAWFMPLNPMEISHHLG